MLQLCSVAIMLSLPCPRRSNISRIPLVHYRMFFFSSPHCVESQAAVVNLLCTFDVKISADLQRGGGGGLCDGVSTVKVTKSCNQCLFTVDPALYFHNISPLILSLIPDCRCDVKGTLSGVGDCQQVSFLLFFFTNPAGDKQLFNQTVIQVVVNYHAGIRLCCLAEFWFGCSGKWAVSLQG